MSGSDVQFASRPAVGVTTLLHRTAQVRPRHAATIEDARIRTWSELAHRVARAAQGFRSLGLQDGDRVAVLAATGDRYFELFATVPHAGGVIVPLNWRWSAAELADALVDAEPKILVVDEAHVAVGAALAAGRPGLVLVSMDGRQGLPGYEQLIAGHTPAPDAARGGDQLYQLGYTGGTTGRSKAAMLSHRNVIAAARSAYTERYFREDSVYLFGAPMFHVSGSWPCISIIGSGGTGVLMPRFDPAAALGLIKQHRVTESILVPTMVQTLIEQPSFSVEDVASFRTVVYGGAPITEALLDRALAAMPHTRFIQIYGMTETSPICASLPHDCLLGEQRRRGINRAAGRATPGVELKVLGPDDRELARGEVGEICARGDNVMLGYWRRPEETAATLRNGWMHTGDGGRMDEDGYVYTVDRIKDVIISGGENIYSTEVENALARHPDVRQCVVIGIPSDKWGEQVHAIVRRMPGSALDDATLIEHVRSLIAAYKVPRSVEFFEGEFPCTPAGKVLKRELRRPYWEDQGTPP